MPDTSYVGVESFSDYKGEEYNVGYICGIFFRWGWLMVGDECNFLCVIFNTCVDCRCGGYRSI